MSKSILEIDVIVAEIGSTTTVVNAFNNINGEDPEFLGQGQSPTTVFEGGDVRNGLSGAIKDLAANLNVGEIKYKDMFATSEFTNWHKNWQESLERQEESIDEAYELMNKSNPVVIPRNHRVEEALKSADNGDFSVMEIVVSILSNPYEYKEEMDEYTELAEPSDLPYRTYCGT